MEYIRNKRYGIHVTMLAGALAGLCQAALCLGRYSMNPVHVLRALAEKITQSPPTDAAMQDVLFIIRMPRIAAAVLVGAALSLSGSVYQGVFKNPLVSPDLLGVSSGACVGAAVAILLGGGMVMIQISAFAMGMAAIGITTAIPRLLKN